MHDDKSGVLYVVEQSPKLITSDDKIGLLF